MLAHDAGTLERQNVEYEGRAVPRDVWVCDCQTCATIMLREPHVPMVIKGGSGRYGITAGELALVGPDAIAAAHGDYVREVFVRIDYGGER
jgi:hypothetical protein